MSYVERGSLASVSGYIWYTRDKNYAVTEKDIGTTFKWYYKRRDILYGGYVYNTDGAKQYFRQYIAPRILDEAWTKIVSEGHEPLYGKVRIVDVSPYFWDKYYFTYEVEFYFKIRHASPISIGLIIDGIIVIIILALSIFLVQQLGVLAEQVAQGFQVIVYAIKDLITPLIPVIILMITFYLVYKMTAGFTAGMG